MAAALRWFQVIPGTLKSFRALFLNKINNLSNKSDRIAYFVWRQRAAPDQNAYSPWRSRCLKVAVLHTFTKQTLMMAEHMLRLPSVIIQM